MYPYSVFRTNGFAHKPKYTELRIDHTSSSISNMKLASLSDTSPPLPSSGTYIYKILPLLLPSPCTLVTVSSDDALRLYDAATLRPASNGPPAPVHAGVTCLQPFDADVCSVLTGGRDACIRCWDLRVGKKSWELVDGMRWKRGGGVGVFSICG